MIYTVDPSRVSEQPYLAQNPAKTWPRSPLERSFGLFTSQ